MLLATSNLEAVHGKGLGGYVGHVDRFAIGGLNLRNNRCGVVQGVVGIEVIGVIGGDVYELGLLATLESSEDEF